MPRADPQSIEKKTEKDFCVFDEGIFIMFPRKKSRKALNRFTKFIADRLTYTTSDQNDKMCLDQPIIITNILWIICKFIVRTISPLLNSLRSP